MKKCNITPWDFYQTCVNLSPQVPVSVYFTSQKGVGMPVWTGEFRSMPKPYRYAIIDYMYIYTDEWVISKIVFTLQNGGDDYGKA